MANRLSKETSPYLLQHAHNPVDWYPWGEEALRKAIDENKVIIVSIGYSACHWCHVMEKESFENADVARFMNDHFVNIKIDREERPDLDHIYMDAVQAMTGSGGWPLNVFLTPAKEPFYGGTYFPPVRAFNRASWMEVLQGVHQSWIHKKDEIDQQASELTKHLRQSNELSKALKGSGGSPYFTKEECDTAFENIMKQADKDWGGFGRAPKFPQTFTIQFLFEYYFNTGNEKALQQALLSIDKMIEGGIYDHVGGGFARYSTDAEWHVPHFEKMLYDNALLLNVLSDAYAITRDKKYERVVRETIGFITRELMHEKGGFYSALDADSEGEEGKFYVWTKQEIDGILGRDAALFCEYFNVTEKGNWAEPGHVSGTREKNVLRTLEKAQSFAIKKGLGEDEFTQKIDANLEALFTRRNTRLLPSKDDKILLNWNALMISALCRSASVFSEKSYLDLAIKNYEFLLEELSEKGGNFFSHTWKNSEAKFPAFLDDLAFLADACIQLFETTSEISYLSMAERVCDYIVDQFSDEDSTLFFFTNAQQHDVILRKKEVYDGAVPSGNSLMAKNLLYLGTIFDKKNWTERGQKMLMLIKSAAWKYPTSFGIWASLHLRYHFGVKEVVVAGTRTSMVRDAVLHEYIPGKTLICSAIEHGSIPLLTAKDFTKNASVYVCENNTCEAPIQGIENVIARLKKPL